MLLSDAFDEGDDRGAAVHAAALMWSFGIAAGSLPRQSMTIKQSLGRERTKLALAERDPNCWSLFERGRSFETPIDLEPLLWREDRNDRTAQLHSELGA